MDAKAIAGLEITFGGALAAMLVGGLVGVVIQLLLTAQPPPERLPPG